MSHAELLQPLLTALYPCELFIPSNCQQCFTKKHFSLFFSFFAGVWGGGAVFQKPRRMHKHKRAQVKVQLFKVDNHHGGSLEEFQAGWNRTVWKRQDGGRGLGRGWGGVLEPYQANHLVCPDRVSVFRLSIWSPVVIWVVNSSAVYIQLSFGKQKNSCIIQSGFLMYIKVLNKHICFTAEGGGVG